MGVNSELGKRIVITDLNGRVIKSMWTSDSSITFDLSDFAIGIYVVSVHSYNQNQIFKIVKN